MSVTPADVLADLPEWAGASIVPLPGGQTNRNWLVEASGRKAVLKIDQAPRNLPFNSRPEEARIQRRAAKKGLANPVLLATETVYMTEYVEGVVWSPGFLEDERNVDRLARALRRVHSLPSTGRTFDAMSAATDYAQRIRQRDEAKIRSCLEKISAVSLPPGLCCCHNDLVVENIIDVPDTRFLDWEYACDNDPLFDLATIVVHHDMAERQIQTLLDAYFDGDGSRWREQLDRQAGVYESLLYLWERARLWRLPTVS
jgi:thiamine kinase-like enzyme